MFIFIGGIIVKKYKKWVTVVSFESETFPYDSGIIWLIYFFFFLLIQYIGGDGGV